MFWEEQVQSPRGWRESDTWELSGTCMKRSPAAVCNRKSQPNWNVCHPRCLHNIGYISAVEYSASIHKEQKFGLWIWRLSHSSEEILRVQPTCVMDYSSALGVVPQNPHETKAGLFACPALCQSQTTSLAKEKVYSWGVRICETRAPTHLPRGYWGGSWSLFSFSLVSFTLKPTKEIRHAVVDVKLRTCILKHWVFLPLMGEGVWGYVGVFLVFLFI